MSNFRQNFVRCLILMAGLFLWQGPLSAQETYDLTDQRRADDVVSVKVTVATQGVVQGATIAGKEDQKVEMSVRGQLAYDERLATTGQQNVAIREYTTATAQMVVGKLAETNSLDTQRNVVIATDRRGARLYSPMSPLTRQEYDLLNAPACSLSAYGLLPSKPVAVGSQWQPSSTQLADVLRLDHVGVNGAHVQLVDVARGLARMKLTGTIKGSVDGATTDMVLSGDIRFDLRWKHLTWVQLNIQEERGEGPVSVPYSARADVRMLIAPVEGTSAVTEVPASIAKQGAGQADTLRYASDLAGFEVLHNKDWHVTAEQARRATFRLIDKNKVVAQCNISRLPRLATGRQLALDEFQADIRKALGEQFGEFESARKSPGPDGVQILRVAARGIVSKIPIRWVYYHVGNTDGERAAFVFTLSDELSEKFAGRDQLMVDSIRFGESPEPTTSDTPNTASAPQTRR